MEATRQGGTRFSGLSPLKVPGLPVVSIITVVYNGAALLPKTMQSVLGQSWPNIEYILIDGGSGDGTTEIISSHESRVAYWVSEPDKGLYHAMNKGLAAATGDYVWFMNCGDLIYSDTTLSQIFAPFQLNENAPVNRPSLPDILYGDAMIVDESYREVGLRRLRPPETLTWKSFQKGMVVCHQAILVKREIADPFDVERYGHSADYDWVLRALIKADRRQKAGDRRQETEDIRQETEDGRAGDWRPDNGKPPHAGEGDEVSYPFSPPAGPVTNPRLQPGGPVAADWRPDTGKPLHADQIEGARHPGPSPDGPMTSPRLQPGGPVAADWRPDTGKPLHADQIEGARHPGPSPDGPMTTPRLQPGASTPTYNTHLILCAFLDGGHSKRNIGISLRERFDSMRRHYGMVPTLLRHIPIVMRFGWYVLLNRRF
jgi:hypothetical protein